MKYIGKFKDINNKSFRIEMVTLKDDTSSENIILTDEPFTSSCSGNDENIYEPIRSSEATLELITDTPLLDVYSKEAMGTSIKLIDDVTNEILWTGYVEPQIYDQDWETDTDSLEINCLDGLAILQYIDYEAKYKKLLTFPELITKILKKLNCYNYFYLPMTLSINGNNQIIKDFQLSENNFFDEDGEPMTSQEVLEEVCKFLGFTCTSYKDSVFFLDYDGIKKEKNMYIRYNLNDNTNTIITVSDIQKIEGNSYSSDGNSISMTPVYNKVVVKDDLYPIDNFIPNIWDGLRNVNKHPPVEEFRTPPGMPLGAFRHANYFQFFKSPNYTCFSYLMTGDVQKDLMVNWSAMYANPDQIEYQHLNKSVGAVICKHKCIKAKYEAYQEPTKLSLSKFLLIYMHDQFPIGLRPIMTITGRSADSNAVVGSKTYLLFTGSAVYMDDIDPNGGGKSQIIFDEEHKRKSEYIPDNCYLDVKLKVGNKYWDGSNWVTSSDTTFKLWFDPNANGDENFIGKTFPIKNNVKWNDYIGKEGYKIPLDEGMKIFEPDITIYYPQVRVQSKYRSEAIWIKDFDIEMVVANVENTDLVEEGDKSDTEYTNIPDATAVKEMQDINFKVCTYDNKTPNYSSVAIKDVGLIDKVKHLDYEDKRMEENLINKLVLQYKYPGIILDLKLKNDYKPYSLLNCNQFSDKKFILDSYNINWALNQQDVHLVEKK